MESFLKLKISQVCEFLMTRKVEEEVVERFRYEKVCHRLTRLIKYARNVNKRCVYYM